MSSQLEVRLWPKKDRNGDEYLIGAAQTIPALVDLREATFVVFYPPEDEPGTVDENGRVHKPHATLIIRRDQREQRDQRDQRPQTRNPTE